MPPVDESGGRSTRKRGFGQVVLEPAEPAFADTEEMADLYRLSDPRLSELDLDELLDELLVRVREALGVDTVAILLLEEETQELVARAAKGLEDEVTRGVRIPIGEGFAGRIAAEHVAIFVPDVDRADILNPILREKGVRSLLGVPLIVEGKVIGVLHVGSLRPRTFGPKDQAILLSVAARAAPGIEGARLFAALEHEHRIAMALQRSLLPARLAAVDGIAVAARYLPARDLVGGDWYDVIDLRRGLVGLAIGDVVGHGIRAAAMMGQLRTALRAYALEGHGPARTLELVDGFVRMIDDCPMATAAYALLETDTGTLRFAIAGHMPPIVIRADESTLVDVAPAPPLGVLSAGSCPEHALSLGDGETIMLYTDGLVERRGERLDDGIHKLITLVRGAISAEDACHRAVAGMVRSEDLDDDVAIVAMHSARPVA